MAGFTPTPYPYLGYANEIIKSNQGTVFDASDIYKREYTKTFRVRVADPRVGPETVCRAPGIPAPYTPYASAGNFEYDLSAVVVGLEAAKEVETDWQNWIVTVKYSTELGNVKSDFGFPSKKDGGTANHPELEPPVLDWDFEVVKEAMPTDLNGRPFINSAGDLYEPAPQIDVARPVLHLQRNQLDFSPVKAQQFAFALNNKMFLGQYPYTAQCYPPKATQKQLGGLIYWRVTYKIRFKNLIPIKQWSEKKGMFVPVDRKQDEQTFLNNITWSTGYLGNPWTLTPGKTWLVELLDAGYNEYRDLNQEKFGGPPGNRTPVPIVAPSGGKPSKPVLLNGDGAKLGIRKKNGLAAVVPVYNQFWCYPDADLNVILQRGV